MESSIKSASGTVIKMIFDFMHILQNGNRFLMLLNDFSTFVLFELITSFLFGIPKVHELYLHTLYLLVFTLFISIINATFY